MNRVRVLITGPSLRDEGGVASYFNAVLPVLQADNRVVVDYCEVGSTRGAAGPLHALVDQVRFYRALRRFRPALVHLNPSLNVKSFIRDGLFARQTRRLGIPAMAFFHGWDVGLEALVDRRFGWFFRMTYARAQMFVVLASRFRDALRRWGVRVPVALETTTMEDDLLNGFSIVDKVASVTHDHTVKILYLARLERAKGIIETLEAVTMLLDQGAPVSLTVAGNGPLMDEVRHYVASRNTLSGHTAVVGYVRGETKRTLLATHHLYCCPSDSEGMPTSVLEAMGFGLPVVTCPVGGMADFFEHGRMGYLVERRSAPLIADALRRLVNDRDTAARMSDYNHHYATRRFLASGVGRRLGEIYLDVMRRLALG